MILLVFLAAVIHCVGCVGLAWIVCDLIGLSFNVYVAIGLWMVVMYCVGKFRQVKRRDN